MSDISYLSGCSAAGRPSLRVLASDKGQGGETVSDVTLPEDQTPFFSPPLMWIMCEGTWRYCTDWKQLLKHASGRGQGWLHAARALTPFQLHPHEEATWNRLQAFGYRNRFGNKSAEGCRRFCCDYVLDIRVADDWRSGIFCKPE